MEVKANDLLLAEIGPDGVLTGRVVVCAPDGDVFRPYDAGHVEVEVSGPAQQAEPFDPVAWLLPTGLIVDKIGKP